MNIKNKKNRLVRVILPVVAALVITGLGGTWWYLDSSTSKDDVKRDNKGTSLERSNSENTETKNIETDPDAKGTTGSDAPSAPETNKETGLNKANVILTSTGTNGDNTVDSSGFVSNVVEDNGKCTFIFTQGAKSVRKDTTTSTNPTSTTCKTVRFDKSELGTGEWSVVLEYTSPTSSGTSNSSKVTLQ